MMQDTCHDLLLWVNLGVCAAGKKNRFVQIPYLMHNNANFSVDDGFSEREFTTHLTARMSY